MLFKLSATVLKQTLLLTKKLTFIMYLLLFLQFLHLQ